MFDTKYKKILLAVVILLVVIAVGTLIYFIVDFNKVSNNNGEAADAVREAEGGVVKKKNKTNEVEGETATLNLQSQDIYSDQNGDSQGMRMYKGFPMAGTLKIPKINVELPILADSSAKALEVSVTLQPLSAGLNKVGNTTISGHNYKDGSFLSNAKNLSLNDKIYITDYDGNTVEYIIYNIYVTERNDSDYFLRDTDGRREVTLTTCTDDTNITQNINVIWAKENI